MKEQRIESCKLCTHALLFMFWQWIGDPVWERTFGVAGIGFICSIFAASNRFADN